MVFDGHTRHQEPIERDPFARRVSGFWRWSETFLELSYHFRRKGEAESEERLVELFPVDEAGVVSVETQEDPVPVLRVSDTT